MQILPSYSQAIDFVLLGWPLKMKQINETSQENSAWGVEWGWQQLDQTGQLPCSLFRLGQDLC